MMMKGANLGQCAQQIPALFKTMKQSLEWAIHDIMHSEADYESLHDNIEKQEEALLNFINQYVKEIIGNDETNEDGYSEDIVNDSRNDLRAEQRKRAGL